MIKCGKGCMPECQYFTTGGCMSPFNCPYKIETGYINSATSTPHIMSMTNEEMIENLKRVIADISAQCNQLKAENAELKSSLTHANEECLKWHERAQNLLKDSGGSISGYEKKISDLQAENADLRARLEKAVELPTIYEHISYPYIEGMYSEIIYYVIYKENERIMTEKFGKNKSKAEARLKELKEKKDD